MNADLAQEISEMTESHENELEELNYAHQEKVHNIKLELLN
jgi:hypothetical protein